MPLSKYLPAPFLAQFAESARQGPALPELSVAATGLLHTVGATAPYIEEVIGAMVGVMSIDSSAAFTSNLTEAGTDQPDPDRVRARDNRYQAGLISIVTKTVGESDPDRERSRFTNPSLSAMATFYTRDGMDAPDPDRVRSRVVQYEKPISVIAPSSAN